MANLLSTGVYGFLCSLKKTAEGYVEDFMTGFAGHGWKVWEYVKGKWMLEIDELRVRGTMTVFELLISKIRAIKGAQVISQGCGKIKTVKLSDNEVEYLITLEDKEMSFMEHDFIRCQVFNGGTVKLYHVEIDSITEGGVIHIDRSEFKYRTDEYGNTVVINPPEPGDEIVQFGNKSRDEKYKGRHSAIYMHADESGQPAIDVLFDIYTKDFSNCAKIRLGGDIPGEKNMKGFYCENGMIKCSVDGIVTYLLRPDGRAEFGQNSAVFRPDKSGYIAGGAISWRLDGSKYICDMSDNVVLQWGNLSQDAKDNLKGDKGDKGDQGPRGLTGLQGSKGEQGIQGPAGKDGTSTYFHIKYSSVPKPEETDQMTETPSTYIGTYVDTIPFDSGDPYDYTWARFEGLQGSKGDQGIPGRNGEDGLTYYLHIKYSNDGGKTFTGNNGEDSGSWIGVCTNTYVDDPDYVGAYKWSKIKGEDANLLPWVEDWNNATKIDNGKVISPRIFSGKQNSDGTLTGVALGREVVTVDGTKKTGLFGLKDGILTYSLDAATGDFSQLGYAKKIETYITPDNFMKFTKIHEDEYGDEYNFDFYKTGSFIVVTGNYTQEQQDNLFPIFNMPSIPVYPDTEENKMEVRKYIGNTLTIYNKSNMPILIQPVTFKIDSGSYVGTSIEPGRFGYFKCYATVKNDMEEVYWFAKIGQMR